MNNGLLQTVTEDSLFSPYRPQGATPRSAGPLSVISYRRINPPHLLLTPPHIRTHERVFPTKPWSPWAVDPFGGVPWWSALERPPRCGQTSSFSYPWRPREGKRCSHIIQAAQGSSEQPRALKLFRKPTLFNAGFISGRHCTPWGDILHLGESQRSEKMPSAFGPGSQPSEGSKGKAWALNLLFD